MALLPAALAAPLAGPRRPPRTRNPEPHVTGHPGRSLRRFPAARACALGPRGAGWESVPAGAAVVGPPGSCSEGRSSCSRCLLSPGVQAERTHSYCRRVNAGPHPCTPRSVPQTQASPPDLSPRLPPRPLVLQPRHPVLQAQPSVLQLRHPVLQPRPPVPQPRHPVLQPQHSTAAPASSTAAQTHNTAAPASSTADPGPELQTNVQCYSPDLQVNKCDVQSRHQKNTGGQFGNTDSSLCRDQATSLSAEKLPWPLHSLAPLREPKSRASAQVTSGRQAAAPRPSHLCGSLLRTGQVLPACPSWAPQEAVEQVAACRTQDQHLGEVPGAGWADGRGNTVVTSKAASLQRALLSASACRGLRAASGPKEGRTQHQEAHPRTHARRVSLVTEDR
ncbi:uncharacterized protein LOC109489543 [Ailuropoda melanoleuca]|uniref:uncharacterized protein LOC109489543 n=1 Tax=Ailuropoda melanoleuca TaxID=9646 RepID=UPI001494E57C|nr:uncharacterized protein LOC109489543 [Ailuropoda melanoleuca]